MRRCFIVFLMLLVQVQFVWGAAASYCTHEASPVASAHFGHHDHRHEGSDLQNARGDGGATVLPSFDLDCGSCNLGTLGTLSSCATAVANLPGVDHQSGCSDVYRSHFPSGLERPDRSAHVAAS